MASTQKPKSQKTSRHPLIVIMLCLVIILAIVLIPARPTTDTLPKSFTNATTNKSAAFVLKLPSDFTLNDKIGQLLMVGVTNQKMATDLEKDYQVGGFLLRPGSGLFSREATNAIIKASELTPLLAVDEEGGQISRLPEVDFSKDSAKYMGGLPNAEVQQIGYMMGQAMGAIGVNVDFAPVADLDDGHNAIISALDRSFSGDPAIVSEKAQAFSAGLRQAKIVPTFKHFPGLGNATGPTDGNTDDGPATSPPLGSLEQNDLIPYKTLLQPDLLSMVMVGNQIVPNLTNGLPASLSSSTYSLLRNQYNFQQVVLTDELILAKAIHSVEPNPAQAVITAISAGADMPLIDPPDEQTVASIIQAVTDAVRSGQITQSQIDASLARILQLKTEISK